MKAWAYVGGCLQMDERGLWIPELRHYASGVPIILVGTKLGSSVSQTANPQLELMVSGACAGDSRPTVNKLGSDGFGATPRAAETVHGSLRLREPVGCYRDFCFSSIPKLSPLTATQTTINFHRFLEFHNFKTHHYTSFFCQQCSPCFQSEEEALLFAPGNDSKKGSSLLEGFSTLFLLSTEKYPESLILACSNFILYEKLQCSEASSRSKAHIVSIGVFISAEIKYV
ncbi:hypothetical protein CFP56_033107 [Quercus suber]|uniref:Uncharacterized protein n=1 Tax=Quercus suber TaxID=58331 RepID=A0AAW0JH07_QUESU